MTMPPNDYSHRRTQRLYRSRENCIIGGVCGGIAEHFDTSPWLVRCVALILQFTLFPMLFLFYPVLWFFLKVAPPRQYPNYQEEDFWHTYQSSRSEALRKVNHAFERLDRRLQRMETQVTSRSYDLEDEFRNL